MRVQPRSAPPASSSTSAARREPPPAETTSAARTGRAGWSAPTGGLARDLREKLTHPQGRETFAELLENQLGDPNEGIGYVWDPADDKALQWTLRNSEVGDDSLLVRVTGKELTIQSEMSGFEGKATFKGSSRKALNDAIMAASRDLTRVTDEARGR
jgi:hypothetical protein